MEKEKHESKMRCVAQLPQQVVSTYAVFVDQPARLSRTVICTYTVCNDVARPACGERKSEMSSVFEVGDTARRIPLLQDTSLYSFGVADFPAWFDGGPHNTLF